MNTPAQLPTIGRIVHYQAFGTPGGEFKSVARAAIVTDVLPFGSVSLCVLNPSGMFFNLVTQYDDSAEPKGGTWHWPPRA